MRNVRLQIATHVQDLAPMTLPVGTRIATAHSKIFELDEIEAGRVDAGSRYWIEPGTLQPFPYALEHWLPAVIIPPLRKT